MPKETKENGTHRPKASPETITAFWGQLISSTSLNRHTQSWKNTIHVR